MSFDWTPPPEPTTLNGKFAAITNRLNATLLGCAMPGGFLTHAMWSILNGWIFKHILRIRLLIAALQAGTVRTRTCPAPGLTRQAAADRARAAWTLPRRFAWLLTMMDSQRHLMPHGQMQHLLADPEMLALLAASPRLVRTMRPFCRALGVEMPTFPTLPVPPVAGPESGAVPDGAATVGAATGTPDALPPVAPAADLAVVGHAVARFAAGDPRFRK
jgi:hypothetical protein